jgi:uncharacterized protein (TIGR02266 family)
MSDGRFELKPHCPYCMEDIASDEIQCPSCGVTYGLDTLLLVKKIVKESMMEVQHEHRKQYRVPKTLKVTYSSPQALVNSYLSNIGEGGVFIPTKEPLDRKEKIKLKIFLPGEKKALEVLGEVAWSNKEQRVTPKKTFPAGMGVRFLKLSFEDKERIIGMLSQSSD